jgi:hypothetical protein
MSKSPGHRDHPEHEIREQHLTEQIRARVGGLAFYDDNIREIEVRPKP